MFSSLLFAIGVQGKAGNKMHSRITITTTFVKLLQAESRWMDTFCTKSVQRSTGYTCFVARRHDSQEVVFLYSVKHLLLAAIFKPERPNIPVTLSMYLWICNFRISSQNSGRFVVIYRGTFYTNPTNHILLLRAGLLFAQYLNFLPLFLRAAIFSSQIPLFGFDMKKNSFLI